MSEFANGKRTDCTNCRKAREHGVNYKGQPLYTCKQAAYLSETKPHAVKICRYYEAWNYTLLPATAARKYSSLTVEANV